MFVEHKELGEPCREPLYEGLDEVSKLLLKAANLIEQYGLAKWWTCDRQKRLCIRGALLVADGAPHEPNGPDMGQASLLVREADRRLGENLQQYAPTWNNKRERTAGEVIAKLRAVALGG